MLTLDERVVHPRTPVSWLIISFLSTLVGIGAFLYGATGEYALRTWQTFTVNYIFWAGLAFGSVLFSAVLNLSKAVWGRPVKRLAESFSAYLPVSFLLFWVLWKGKDYVFPWILKPLVEKQNFLNAPFMFARQGIFLFALTAISIIFVYSSVKSDKEWLERGRPEISTEYPWKGTFRFQWRLSPVLPAVYAVTLSLLAVDLIMSLSPEWISTLFPGYYFTVAFYSSITAICLMMHLVEKKFGLGPYLHSRQFHDLGKLIFGFAIFTGYLFYAQLLVIWYGNLPEETQFVILRTRLNPWKPWAFAVLAMVFAIPFLTLLSRNIKVKRIPMIVLSVIVLAGIWMERFLLVVPSIWGARPGIPFGILEILISVGFAGLVLLCITAFLSRVPVVPVSDPLFHKFLQFKEGNPEP